MVGLTTGYDRVVVRGDRDQGQFSAFCYKSGHLVGIESVNRAGDTCSAGGCLRKMVQSFRSRRPIPASI